MMMPACCFIVVLADVMFLRINCLYLVLGGIFVEYTGRGGVIAKQGLGGKKNMNQKETRLC